MTQKEIYGADQPVVTLDKQWGMVVRLIHGIPYVPFITEATVDILRSKFVPRDSDVFIATSPKCGTTWMQQIVLLLNHFKDTSAIKSTWANAPWIEACLCKGDITIEELMQPKEKSGDRLSSLGGGRRVFKTHAPWHLLPCRNGDLGKAKVIYVSRNVKDACVSAFFHNRSLPKHNYDGPWEHFVDEMYPKGRLEHGSWFDHVAGWWKAHLTSPDRILWINFEDLKAKPEDTIKRIVKFLNIQGNLEELLKATLAGSKFEVMRSAHEKANRGGQRKLVDGKFVGHFRDGKSGSWRDKFTVAQSLRYDKLLEEKLGHLPGKLRVDFGKGDVWISQGPDKPAQA